MREILFRGRDLDKKQWRYGDLIHYTGAVYIQWFEDYQTRSAVVFEDTVGQYTGMNDIKGNKIFEGDIVALSYDVFDVKVITEVVCEKFSFPSLRSQHQSIEVIGNVHDNPELMKGCER